MDSLTGRFLLALEEDLFSRITLKGCYCIYIIYFYRSGVCYSTATSFRNWSVR